MIHRQSPIIEIYRKNAVAGLTTQTLVASVPITGRCKRRFKLMKEDFLQLEFSLAQAVHFSIGDYCMDELFGNFVVTEEQMPKYNSKTGGFDYTLKLEKDYMVWKNWVHCLAVSGQRMESRWSLTDKLSVHAQQIADGINIVTGASYVPLSYEGGTGISTGYGISVTAENAGEVKYISYDGKDFISAMNAIASEWQCEWWVTDDKITVDGVRYDHTIHFGKCELNNDPFVFELGVNVESMDVARDQQEYATRLYAYGGTQNVPETYDRELVFELTDDTNGYIDSTRPLTVDMVDGDATIQKIGLVFGAYSVDDTVTNKKVFTSETNTAFVNSGKVSVNGVVATRCFNISQHFQADCVVKLHLGATSKVISTGIVRTGKVCQCNARVDEELNLSVPLAISIDVEWTIIKPSASSEVFNPSVEDFSGIHVTPDQSGGTIGIYVKVGNSIYNATLDGQTGRFTFDDEAPSNFGLGEGETRRYTITNLTVNIPLSYYTPIYDTGTMSKVNDRRIHLPLSGFPNRYAELSTPIDPRNVVEKCVLFEKIFPKLSLRVSSVNPIERKEKIEHEDGTVTWEQWTQYSIKVTKTTQTDGEYDPFDFKESYLLDQAKLQGVFTIPSGEQTTGFMLAGMTFDLGFNGIEYTIIRNEDFGAKLPNDILKPSVGDELVLTGWNPCAMQELDMISDAETELATEVNKYLRAIKDGQFTFTNRMMSDFLFSLVTGLRFIAKDNAPFVVVEDEAFYVLNGFTNYALLQLGARVTVKHNALPLNGNEHSKTSRVIGYEYKLDMPYDTPTYIVGETDAYSRLKRIEKELTKLS